MLWALERIDPRLPKKVKKNYGHQMVGDNCLVSLQPTIFQNIKNMLDELDSADSIVASQCLAQTECNQIYSKRQENMPRNARKEDRFTPNVQTTIHVVLRRNYFVEFAITRGPHQLRIHLIQYPLASI